MVLQEWSKLGGRRKRGKHGDGVSGGSGGGGGGGGGSDTSKEDSSDSERVRWVVSDHVSILQASRDCSLFELTRRGFRI